MDGACFFVFPRLYAWDSHRYRYNSAIYWYTSRMQHNERNDHVDDLV